MSLKEILDACAELARDGGVGALASVARRHGSLPMSATAKMLVRPDGSRIGTVGGGCLEAEIAERSLDVIERRMPVITEHSLNSEIAGDYGLACGGTAIMFIEPVYPHPVLEAFYSESARTLERGDRALAATALDWSRGPLKALLCDGKLTGADVPLLRNSFGTFRADHEAHRLDEVAFVEPISGAVHLHYQRVI